MCSAEGVKTVPVRRKDIARDLGLSVITVSKALRNSSDISAKTRLRVLRRCEELNYRPNLAARSLVTGHTNNDGSGHLRRRPGVFSELARRMSGVLRSAGFTRLITSSEQQPELERQIVDQLLSRRVDALLIVSTQFSPQTVQQLKEEGIPHILLDRKFEGFPSHFVGVDDHTHQVCIHVYAYRHESYLSDAIFCYNDFVAVGAMQAILEAGLRIPVDIALMGCGNLHFANYLRVPLSSVDQQSAAIGVRGGRSIWCTLTGPHAQRQSCLSRNSFNGIPPGVDRRCRLNAFDLFSKSRPGRSSFSPRLAT